MNASAHKTMHRAILMERGYSLRKAAAALSVGPQHLVRVLNGQRESAKILAAIEALPPSATPRKLCGFASKPCARHHSRQRGGTDAAHICEAKGYTLRAAAEAIGVDIHRIHDHLSGASRSQRIEAALAALPDLSGHCLYGRAGRAHAIKLGREAIAAAGVAAVSADATPAL